jgi:hypothetical protein
MLSLQSEPVWMKGSVSQVTAGLYDICVISHSEFADIRAAGMSSDSPAACERHQYL